METILFTPVKSQTQGVKRRIQPSPEKKTGMKITYVDSRPASPAAASSSSSPSSSTESPTKKRLLDPRSRLRASPSFPFFTQNTAQTTLNAISQSTDLVLDISHLPPVQSLADVDPRHLDLLMTSFPGCTDVSRSPPFIIIKMKSLPPGRLPLTIWGIPAYFQRDDEPTFPFVSLLGVPYGGNLHLFKHLTISKDNWFPILSDAVQWFKSELNIDVRAMDWGSGFISVQSDYDAEKLLPVPPSKRIIPEKIAGTVVWYRKRPLGEIPFAHRGKEVTGLVNDDTDYSKSGVLRPGIMVASKKDKDHPNSGAGSTSEFAVRDVKTGERFITVAAHAWSKIGEGVFHPTPNGTQIGVIKRWLGNPIETDVALVALDPKFEYSDTTFDHGDDEYRASPMTGICKNWTEVRSFDKVVMNSPLSGFVTGLVIMEGLTLKITGENVSVRNNPHEYTATEYTYFGNTTKEVQHGTCGTAIVRLSDHKILSIFNLINKETNTCYGINTQVFKRFGYEFCGKIPASR